MVLIFVPNSTVRHTYTFDFIFKSRSIDYKIISDHEEFCKYKGAKINYSDLKLTESVEMPNAGLLNETKLNKNISVGLGDFKGFECLKINNVDDLFSSVFFVLSRYEEYLIEDRDGHSRFIAANSLQYKYNWLDKCICDRWAEHVISLCGISNENTKNQKINFVLSFDVDNVRAFEWKGWIRQIKGAFLDIIQLNFKQIKKRIEVFRGLSNDPFNTFSDVISIANKKIDCVIFWLVGKHSKYDRNLSVANPHHQNQIKELSSTCEIGLHPSYLSNTSKTLLREEINVLTQILDKKVTKSRQHFLKLDIPYTYQNLLKNGFTDDYSMGYAESVGFRAGTARPICFFDLSSNSSTNLTIHSFCYMDATLKEYLRNSPIESEVLICNLFKEVKSYGGEFIPLWHNESINDYGRWEGWKRVFDYTVNLSYEI